MTLSTQINPEEVVEAVELIEPVEPVEAVKQFETIQSVIEGKTEKFKYILYLIDNYKLVQLNMYLDDVESRSSSIVSISSDEYDSDAKSI